MNLAIHDNIAVKITGACTLSYKAFPYNDIWEPLGRIFDAFGIDRCMWGTDWTRAVALLTYRQVVDKRVGDWFGTTDDLHLITPHAERERLGGDVRSLVRAGCGMEIPVGPGYVTVEW